MEFPSDVMGRFIARLTGPLKGRFILQPIMAILLGIRHGVHDAKVGRLPILWDLFDRSKGHKPNLREALKTWLVPLVIATVLDGIVQYLMFGWVRLSGAVTAGVTLMALPYLIARAVTNRIVSWRNRTSVSSSIRS
jgi:hypothetical protein